MRFIDKRTVCEALKRRRDNKPQTDIDAKKAWRRFNKQAIRKACYKQQRGLCAYTELSLDDETLGCHLEHIAPRSRYPERTFNMDNIILASLDDRYAGKFKENELFGGHHKKASYSDSWFIGPFDTRCELFFRYCDKTGYVLANDETSSDDQSRTSQTIEVLNLNCTYLVQMRQQELQRLNNDIRQQLRVDYDLIEQRQIIRTFRETELNTCNKKLPIFFSAKKQLLNRVENELHKKMLHH